MRDVFDEEAEPVPLDIWLATPLVADQMTADSFIRMVANKDGGAHFAPIPLTQRLKELGVLQSHLITEIARSIIPQIGGMLYSTYGERIKGGDGNGVGSRSCRGPVMAGLKGSIECL